MSDIDVIKMSLNPWYGRDGQPRFYVNDWKYLLERDVAAYCMANGCPDDATRYGSVWYDSSALAHADGIRDYGLSRFIERTMNRTQFLGVYERPMHEYEWYDWTELSHRVPRDFIGDPDDHPLFARRGVNVFHYNGRDFYVEHSYLMEQMESNALAYRHVESGKVWFECEASDLWEFVLELVNDAIMTGEERAEADPLFGPTAPVVPKKEEPAPREGPIGAEPFRFRTQLTESEKEQRRIEWIEAESRPRTRWNKRDIIDNCREAKVPRKAMMVLERMKLDEILSRFLIYDYTDMTGNSYNYEQRRHTCFYRLDMDGIRALDPTLDTFGRRTVSHNMLMPLPRYISKPF